MQFLSVKFQAIMIIACVLSYFFSIICILIFKNFQIVDKSFRKVQTAHINSTPRLGGLGILFSIITVELIFGGIFRLWFFICLVPIFVMGFLEDIHFETKPKIRLLVGSMSSLLAIFLSKQWLISVDFPFFDYFLQFAIIGIFFTVFASVGMINAINFIDGIHGFASAKIVVISIGIFLISSKVGEERIAIMGALVACASLGLFFVSYPKGRIFLGDAGAYCLGFILAWQLIILLSRNPELSAWSLLALVFWPVMDTLFSIFRRILKGKPTNRPDLLHFHQLIMRAIEIISKKEISRRISNPLATAIILPFTFFPIIFGVKYSHDVNAGLTIILISATLYVLSYYTIILVLKKHRIRNSTSKFYYAILEFYFFINKSKK